MSKHTRICFLAVCFLFSSGILFAQSASQPPAAVSSETPAESGNAVQGEHHSKYLSPGDKPIENEDEEENSQFKYSPTVRLVAKKAGISKEAVYWIFFIINFAILAAGAVWVLRKAMPNGFAPRTAEIQKGIEEARKASAEAGARLSEIEGRLAKLDTEIAGIRSAAESDFSAEEQRIKADAERDAQQVIASAEQEIAAAARTVQRDLKAFVAGLAVDLAEKKIRVDDATDQALVSGFAAQLGKDGQ
jgi:F-type H+-transporting ATPase subunit b